MESKNGCRNVVLYVLSAKKVFKSVTLVTGAAITGFRKYFNVKNVVTCDSLPDRCLAADNIQQFQYQY